MIVTVGLIIFKFIATKITQLILQGKAGSSSAETNMSTNSIMQYIMHTHDMYDELCESNLRERAKTLSVETQAKLKELAGLKKQYELSGERHKASLVQKEADELKDKCKWEQDDIEMCLGGLQMSRNKRKIILQWKTGGEDTNRSPNPFIVKNSTAELNADKTKKPVVEKPHVRLQQQSQDSDAIKPTLMKSSMKQEHDQGDAREERQGKALTSNKQPIAKSHCEREKRRDAKPAWILLPIRMKKERWLSLLFWRSGRPVHLDRAQMI
ncbi:hypothetical protein AALO_G00024790 [Alosa alosa]|uniref:Uncharacterized protein n=1 Tax=Alosa alosa TaxID=278164 RepID=A0AAV6HAZ2_9TELE|nr:hypothetical protein AALO_G00024790 [Alosa alosa]